MIKKVVKKINLKKDNPIKDNLEFWLSKVSEERVSAVEYLRRQYNGNSARLQRVVRITQRT